MFGSVLTFIYGLIHACVQICMYAACIHIHTHVCTRTYVPTHIYTCIHPSILPLSLTHTHTHTHTHTRVSLKNIIFIFSIVKNGRKICENVWMQIFSTFYLREICHIFANWRPGLTFAVSTMLHILQILFNIDMRLDLLCAPSS